MNVDRIQVDHYGAMLEALQDIYKEARNGNLPYKTLVIDTGDRLWDMCARQVIRDYNASQRRKNLLHRKHRLRKRVRPGQRNVRQPAFRL